MPCVDVSPSAGPGCGLWGWIFGCSSIRPNLESHSDEGDKPLPWAYWAETEHSGREKGMRLRQAMDHANGFVNDCQVIGRY